jgi:hypothetical protein
MALPTTPNIGDPTPHDVAALGIAYPALVVWLRHVG